MAVKRTSGSISGTVPQYPMSTEDPFSPPKVTAPLFAEQETFSVRAKYKVRVGTVYQVLSGLSPQIARNYLALNSLGEVKLRPAQVMAKMQSDWSKVFPHGAKGSYGTNKVFFGQVFRLPGISFPYVSLALRVPFVGKVRFRVPVPETGNYVIVSAVSPTSVTVQ